MMRCNICGNGRLCSSSRFTIDGSHPDCVVRSLVGSDHGIKSSGSKAWLSYLQELPLPFIASLVI